MKEDKRPIMVTIRCITYNQELYIRKCLEGFVMQKTNFRFEAIVHDDASTDGTAEIILEFAKKHPDIIIPVIETENQYSKCDGSIDRIMDSYTHGKYIALCEGDDYWTDPLKLQKQVEFLESHPDYVLVHTDFMILNEKSKRIKHHGSRNYQIYEGNVTNTLFNGCWIRTLTVCYRNINYNLDVKYPQGMFKGDIFLFFLLSLKGKFHFLKEETGVYRIVSNSVSHQSSENRRWMFNESLRKLDYFMADYINADRSLRDRIEKKWLVSDFKHSLRAGDYRYYQKIEEELTKHNFSIFLQLCIIFARIKSLFYFMSDMLILKNKIRNNIFLQK